MSCGMRERINVQCTIIYTHYCTTQRAQTPIGPILIELIENADDATLLMLLGSNPILGSFGWRPEFKMCVAGLVAVVVCEGRSARPKLDYIAAVWPIQSIRSSRSGSNQYATAAHNIRAWHINSYRRYSGQHNNTYTQRTSTTVPTTAVHANE